MIEKLFENEQQGTINTKIVVSLRGNILLTCNWPHNFIDFCHKLNGYEAVLVETDEQGSCLIIVSNIILCRLLND